jgi:hypothetical protein
VQGPEFKPQDHQNKIKKKKKKERTIKWWEYQVASETE